MENLTIKTLKEVQVESEFTLSKYFIIHDYSFYKLLDEKTCLAVTYYPNRKDTIFSLELFPSIRVENIRYVQYMVNKPENYKEITEEEFLIKINECKKFISSL
jgi:hypothetical protein